MIEKSARFNAQTTAEWPAPTTNIKSEPRKKPTHNRQRETRATQEINENRKSTEIDDHTLEASRARWPSDLQGAVLLTILV